jgi:hypothetical protein
MSQLISPDGIGVGDLGAYEASPSTVVYLPLVRR